MTGDELAAAVYAEQGFLILGSTEPRKMGEIRRESVHESWRTAVSTPMRIVGVSTEQEMRRQTERYIQLSGAHDHYQKNAYTHYYRVEAAD